MDTPQHIAAALERVKKRTAKRAADILQSKEIGRADRELLIKTNWLQEIMRGWYMLVRPDLGADDAVAWYANFWSFLQIYLKERFGDKYCLSAESSLDLYVSNSIIPKQVIVVVPQGGSAVYILPHDTSLLVYADSAGFPQEREVLSGLQVLPVAVALCKVTNAYFRNKPGDAEVALRLPKNPAELSKTILKYGYKSAANRLVGAYEFLGMRDFSSAIQGDLEALGFVVRSENPLCQKKPLLGNTRIRSPYAARIEVLWEESREDVLKVFPRDPGLPKNAANYLQHVNDVYKEDSYNSLSIEGYQVTPELIERVRSKNWNPDLLGGDKDIRNALAARGYYEAFQGVKQTVSEILKGGEAGVILEKDLPGWYRKLFLPSVHAGIIEAEHLMGYRNDRVYIRGSRHVPPPKEAITDAMDALFNCIKKESSAAVRAILGHYLLVFIHPYMDGNGRMARFLMNAMLASGGYSWTIISLKRRAEYMQALKIADENKDLSKLAKFIRSSMQCKQTTKKTHQS
ncbi:MAG: Fic family protein [Gammaproteobacteria bacterium]